MTGTYITQHVVNQTQAGPSRKASGSYARCSAKHLGQRDRGLFTRKSVKQYWERVVWSNLASPSGFSLTNTPASRLFSSFRLLLGKFFSSIETRAFQLNESYSHSSVLGGEFHIRYSTVTFRAVKTPGCEFATAFPHRNDRA